MAHRPPFRGYAQLPRYQYQSFAHAPVHYSTVPLYDAPPAHPPFEPPTDHPVEKDEEEAPETEEQGQPANSIDSPIGDNSPENANNETPPTSEDPADTIPNESPSGEDANTDVGGGDELTSNPDEAAPEASEPAQEINEGSGDAEPPEGTGTIETSPEDAANVNDGVTLKEAEFPPIEPGLSEASAEPDQPEPVSLLRTLTYSTPPTKGAQSDPPVPEDGQATEAPPAAEPPPVEEPLPAAAAEPSQEAAEPSDEKAVKKSKKSSKAKERESKSKAKEKEKAREPEKEKEKEKEKKKREKEEAKASSKKKKGKGAKVAAAEQKAGPDAQGTPPADQPVESVPEDPAHQQAEAPEPPSEAAVEPPTEAPKVEEDKAGAQALGESTAEKHEEATADCTEQPADSNVAVIEATPTGEEVKSPDDAAEEKTEATDSSDPPVEDAEASNPPGESVDVAAEVETVPVAATPDEKPLDDFPAESAATEVELQPAATNIEEKAHDEFPRAESSDNNTATAQAATTDATSEANQAAEISGEGTETSPSADKAEALETPPPAENPVVADDSIADDKVADPPAPAAETETTTMTEDATTEEITGDPQPNSAEVVAVATEPIAENPQPESSTEASQAVGKAIEAEERTTEEPPVEVQPAGDSPPEAPEAPEAKDGGEATVESVPEPAEPSAAEGGAQETVGEPPAADTQPAEGVPIEEAAPTEVPPSQPIVSEETANEVAPVASDTEPTTSEAPAAEPSAAEPLVVEAVVAEAPTPEAAVAEAPAAEPSAAEPLIVEAVAAEAPVTEVPVAEVPVAEVPIPEAPVAEAAVAEAPAAEASVAEVHVTETPAPEAVVAEVPPSPSSEKHRRKKVAGWERPRRHSKISAAGSDLSGSTAKTSPMSDKAPPAATETKEKRHSSRRTFQLDAAPRHSDHGRSDRPKISRPSTSRRTRSHREPESSARPRLLERVKTEADGKVQYRASEGGKSERPSRRRDDDSFRREHRRNREADDERRRERDRLREREKEIEKEIARKVEEERARIRQEEDEKRERRRKRKEEEDKKNAVGDAERRERRHHRHREPEQRREREGRRRDSSPAPAVKIGKSLATGMKNLDHNPSSYLYSANRKIRIRNVGPAGENTLQFWRRKLKWVVVAIFFPEIMLYMAGKQWFSASRLCKKLNQCAADERTDMPTGTPGPFWSESQQPIKAISPGAIAVSSRDPVQPSLWLFRTHGRLRHRRKPSSQFAVSPYYYSQGSRLPGEARPLRHSTIQDKRKADTLAKVLVCVQVSWMLVQTISRRIVGYPITLLEVHTLVHVACAIAMYVLWFQKPLDVRDPAWMDFCEYEDLIAFMLVKNYGLGARMRAYDGGDSVPIKSVEHNFANGSESAYLQVYPPLEKNRPATTSAESDAHADPIMRLSPPKPSSLATPRVIQHDEVYGVDFTLEPSLHGPAVCSLISGESLECGIGPAMKVQSLWGAQEEHGRGGHLQISLTSRDVRRWTLAAQASRRIGEELYRDSPKPSVNYFTSYAHSIFLDRKGLQAGFYGYFCAWASGGLIAALTICMFYGAAHATAWMFIFPTNVERLLWRISCLDTIAGVVSLLACFSIIVFHHEHGQKLMLKSFFSRERGMMPLLYRLVILLGVVNFPFWILSRLYIIVETFISLRHVQLGVYETVEWTEFIPHL
ncbi:MAG: hypothetical protein Q9185_002820 [Variospora sp. 1 TL-2023]